MDALQQLFDAARAAQAHAYAPYSKFKVGAALRGPSGVIHAGCNVENAAYPTGTCAESGAISAMILAGESRIIEILVVGGAGAITPCGACRQRILEFANAETKIHSADTTGVRASYQMSDLLPHSFNSDNLTQPVSTHRENP